MGGNESRGLTSDSATAETDKRAIYAWALYDWANSAFATTVMAGFFPIFFKQYWSDGVEPTESTFRLGVVNSIASVVVLIIAPVLGAIADQGNTRRRFLFAFASLGVLTTAMLFIVAQGEWLLASLLYGLAIIGFAGGNVFYDALLVAVATKDQQHRVSALGFALGYLGGGLLFAGNVVMTLKPELFGLAGAGDAVRWSFVSVAVWWAVFTLPLFRYVPEHGEGVGYLTRDVINEGFGALRQTLRSVRDHREVWQFLVAYWLYIDGVDTIIRMAVAYGADIGLDSNSMIVALLVTQFVGFPAAIVFGRIGERLGAKSGIMIAIGIYSLVTIYAYFMSTEVEFYALAVVIGLVQGGIQALSRSFFSRLIPAHRSAEFFGFYNMMGKFAAVIGPVLMGATGMLTGNPRFGVLTILILFVAGALILRNVNEQPNPV